MPYSRYNTVPVDGEEVQRWPLIVKALQTLSHMSDVTPADIKDTVLSYNQSYRKRWDFVSIDEFFSQEATPDECELYLGSTIPKMATLALQLPDLVPVPIPTLRSQKEHAISLSQVQIACLLANAFFCTFPRRNSTRSDSEYGQFNHINFNYLLSGPCVGSRAAKLRCILHYFTRVIEKPPVGVVTFERHVCRSGEEYNWVASTQNLCRLQLSSTGTIEDCGGLAHADFANKYIGGGVMDHGAVQEEIRFLICPEYLVSLLFCEVMDDNEAIVITGAERFSSYSGYSQTMQWAGDYVDESPRDSYGRLLTNLFAIDALVFRNYSSQFTDQALSRELNKAYIGFRGPRGVAHPQAALATGNWGCGAFGGDKEVKSIIQLMAASAAQRDVVYFTFGDSALAQSLHETYAHLLDRGCTIGQLTSLIRRYGNDLRQQRLPPHMQRSLFAYILEGGIPGSSLGEEDSIMTEAGYVSDSTETGDY
eukprot:Colp12_sorted_trinity150504_noHs@9308